MLIVLLMAGVTILRRAFELVIYMAGLAGDLDMLAFEFESCQAVIELGRSPAIRIMTIGTAQTKSPCMWLILSMAGITILSHLVKIAEFAGVDMTLHTGDSHMFAGNLERIEAVVKIFPEPIHAVMTVVAARAERQGMRRHKPYVDLTMTAVTGFRGEGRDVILMTIAAGEWFTRR